MMPVEPRHESGHATVGFPCLEAAITFELDFTCTWDDEHGLGVRYRDWKIEHIGGWGG